MEEDFSIDVAPDFGAMSFSPLPDMGGAGDVFVSGETAPLTFTQSVWNNADVAMLGGDCNIDDVLTEDAQGSECTIQGKMDIIARGAESSDEDKEAKKADLIQELQEQAQRRSEWLNSSHDFAGMQMSGNDIDKLLAFYQNNPEMLDKLRGRMEGRGKSPHEAKEAVDAFKEYMKLQKKQSEGKPLTPQEQKRMIELSQRHDVREVAQEAVRVAQERGYKMDAEVAQKAAEIATLSSDQTVVKSEVKLESVMVQAQSEKREQNIEDDEGIASADFDEPVKTASVTSSQPVAFVESSARSSFPNAPAIMKSFAVAGAQPVNDSIKMAQLDVSVALDGGDGIAAQSLASKNMPLAYSAMA